MQSASKKSIIPHMTNLEREKPLQVLEVEVGFGKRHTSFHRDPNMSESEGGLIFVDWMGREAPEASYFVIEVEGKIKWGSNEVRLMNDVEQVWRFGDIKVPGFKSENYKLVKKWTREFDRRSGILEAEGVDRNQNPYLLRFKAQPIEIVHDRLPE